LSLKSVQQIYAISVPLRVHLFFIYKGLDAVPCIHLDFTWPCATGTKPIIVHIFWQWLISIPLTSISETTTNGLANVKCHLFFSHLLHRAVNKVN